jgi:glycosyltransferase involved in cell wall biosynthesis
MTVTIVIPIYNAARFLDAALDSIAKQTFTDFECICVDDGSADESPEIVKRRALADSRFRLISQPNSGPAAARNHGMDDSVGEYVICVDADDVMPPHALETLVSLADETRADVVWGQHRRFGETEAFVVTENRNDSRTFSGEKWHDWFDARFAQEKDSDPFYGIPVGPWNKLIRRSSLGELRFPTDRDVIGGDDIMFSAAMLPKMSVVAASAAVTYGYRVVRTSLANIRAPVWLSRYSKAYAEVARILGDRPKALRNFALSALRPGFLRQALDAFLLSGRAWSEPDSAQELRLAFSRLRDAYSSVGDTKFRLWLNLGARGWWRLLAFLYRRSSLYRKSRDWAE